MLPPNFSRQSDAFHKMSFRNQMKEIVKQTMCANKSKKNQVTRKSYSIVVKPYLQTLAEKCESQVKLETIGAHFRNETGITPNYDILCKLLKEDGFTINHNKKPHFAKIISWD